MTYRAKPVVRPRRRLWDSPNRRNLLLNIGFGLVVVVALIVLAIAAALTWYDQHLAPVASVNGESITRDDLQRRFDVESMRLSLAQSRIADEVNAGRISKAQGDQQLAFIQQREQQLASVALERLIDARVQAQLMRDQGLEVTDADVETQLTKEATRAEQRHAWSLDFAPAVADGAEEPTATARSEAKAKAEAAHRDLEAGKSWDEVAKAASVPGGGDLGWVTIEFGLDEPFLDALFALDKDGVTEVIEGEDGTFRVGRVTEIATETVDAGYLDLIRDRGVDPEVYRGAVREDLMAEKLREKVEAEALAEGKQREVLDIFLENTTLPDALPEGAIKTRHILYAPKDDPQGAAQLDAGDPAWKTAEDEAREAYDTLKADISKFDSLAREESDEGGADLTGGKLPWFDPSSSLDPAFSGAIFKSGLEPGQLLEPVKSSFGWHVIQVMYFPTDEEQAEKLKSELEAGADWATIARDYSYGDEAADGGELGWVARYQLDKASEDAIFAAPLDEVTDPVVVAGRGVHLYKVLAEETRTPEGDQREGIEQNAFTNWYEAQKQAFTIERDADFTDAAAGAG